jgi:epoxyqueuosine reductase
MTKRILAQMTSIMGLRVSSLLLNKAQELGADLVGFASVKDLKKSPSFTFAPQMPGTNEGIGTRKNELGLKPGEVKWPDNAKTVMVIAVHHPEDKPEMDWWYGRKDPPGNRILAQVVKSLCNWIPENFDINVVHLPYHVEKGGTYLKDAAVLAALGSIGRNNILVTPKFGPRVRLRALTLDIELASTGPMAFDPCTLCEDLCRKACKQNAFDKHIYKPSGYGLDILPGRDGTFARSVCNLQMEEDNEVANEQKIDGFDEPVKLIKYCRKCELACPVGKPVKL